MNPQVVIIILNWNNWPDTVTCLESLYKIDYPEYGVILVDNGSKDDSVTRIKEHFLYKDSSPQNVMEITELNEENLKTPFLSDFSQLRSTPTLKRLLFIKNSRNYGFTRGNNIGMEYALQNIQPEYLLLLNNDTLVDEKFLTELVQVAQSDPDTGFVGPKIYDLKPQIHDLSQGSEVIQSVGGVENLWRFEPYYRGQGEVDQEQYQENQEVDFISGACMLVKTAMTREIGLFDEDYFSYREENDWCRRGWQAGWKSVYAYRSRIWHREQGSTRELKPLVQYYMIRNKFLFIHKFAAKRELVFFLGYFFLYDFWFYLSLSLFHQKRLRKYNLQLTRSLLKAVRDGLKLLV